MQLRVWSRMVTVVCCVLACAYSIPVVAQRYAADELTHARDKLQAAEKADAAEENDVARKRANEAAADAELASALARSRQVEQAANEQAQSIETLRDEIKQQSLIM